MEDNTNDSDVIKIPVPSSEHMKNLIISSLNALGPLGGIFSSALSNYLTSKRFEHIESMLLAMNQRYEQIPHYDFEEIISSNQFQHLFLRAAEKVQYEHREKKRKNYGVMLANMSADQEFHYDLFEHFLNLLEDFNDIHMAIIMELSENGVCEKDGNGWTQFSKLVDYCSNNTLTPEKEIISSALQKLASYGIVKTRGAGQLLRGTNPSGLWYISLYSITKTGEQFIKYLEG